MKSKILFLTILLSGIFMQSNAQIELTKVKTFYERDIPAYGPITISLYMKEPQIFAFSRGSDLASCYVCYVYNDDFELIKTVKAEDLVPGGKYFLFINAVTGQTPSHPLFASQYFFNSDDLMEFIVVGDDFAAIVNENGEVLFKFNILSGLVLVYYMDIGSKKHLIINDYNATSVVVYKLENNTVSTGKTLFTKVESYPNPAADFINIAYKAQNGQSETLTVTNANGQVMESIVLDPLQELYRLDVSRYAQGMYVYKYGDASGKFVVK